MFESIANFIFKQILAFKQFDSFFYVAEEHPNTFRNRQNGWPLW